MNLMYSIKYQFAHLYRKPLQDSHELIPFVFLLLNKHVGQVGCKWRTQEYQYNFLALLIYDMQFLVHLLRAHEIQPEAYSHDHTYPNIF